MNNNSLCEETLNFKNFANNHKFDQNYRMDVEENA